MTPFRQDIRFATTRDSLRIAYAVAGKGYPLVRAGTWMSNIEFDWRMSVFGPLFRELAARYRFYRYNPRGFGISEGEGGEFSLETLVADLEAVVDAAGLRQFALWGGAGAASLTSIAYAARHPDRVTHLVLSGPIARGQLTPATPPERRERFTAFVKLIELGWGEDNPAFRQIINTQMFPRATPELMAELNELFRITASPRQAARMALATGNSDVSALLPAVACPTLVVHCRHTPLIPVEQVREIVSAIPNARLAQLDSENFIPLQSEPAFEQLVKEFDAFLPREAAAGGALRALSRREREVLELVARGLDNGSIAGLLRLSEKTVRNTVSHIFDKLAVTTRAQAIVLARESGIGS